MKNIIVIIGVIALITAGIIIIPRVKKNNSNSNNSGSVVLIPPQGGILRNGNIPPANTPVKNSPQSASQNNKIAKTNTLTINKPVSIKPAAKPHYIAPRVLGAVTTRSITTTNAAYANDPSAVIPYATSSGEMVYRMRPLNFQITVPSAWLPTADTRFEDDILFYQGGASLVGQVRVLVQMHQTLDSLFLELQRDPNTNVLQRTSVDGIPALSFNSSKYGGYVIATVFHDNIYYFSGRLTEPAVLGSVGFFN